ncbi:MAG: hypothetical protein AAFX79_06905 [Planctomycetota bacterium]
MLAIAAAIGVMGFGLFQLRQAGRVSYVIFDDVEQPQVRWRELTGKVVSREGGDLVILSKVRMLVNYLTDDIASFEELPAIAKHEVVRQRDLPDDAYSYRVRAGWPLSVTVLEGHRTEPFWDIDLAWTGGTLTLDGESVGHVTYRPRVLPLLANIAIFFVPAMLAIGLVRSQIALVRAARQACPGCSYPRQTVTCPECGRNH